MYTGTFTISGRGPLTIPVGDVTAAVDYYTRVLGFSAITQTDTSATLERDEVQIGLEVNGDDPEQASVGFNVSDADVARAELSASGASPSDIRIDTFGGKQYRIFFVREPFGVCFCYSQPL